jgi:hypothetical protein
MERSHPSSGRSATPADINRNGRPTSIGTGGRHQSECPADIIGIRTHDQASGGRIRLEPASSPAEGLHTPEKAKGDDDRTKTRRRSAPKF